MANGDCPVGARNSTRLNELERRMGAIDQHLETLSDCVATHVTEDKVRRAGLDIGSKIFIGVLTGVVGPLVLVVANHFLR